MEPSALVNKADRFEPIRPIVVPSFPAKLICAAFRNDGELSAYKNANEARKRLEGMAGCERSGRTYVVMYLVNTPAGFFDRFTSDWKASRSNYQLAGHRVSRAAAVEGGETHGQQLIEIDATRSVLMYSTSKVAKDAEFATLTSCFFNTLQVVQQ